MAEMHEEQQHPMKRDPRLLPVPTEALTTLAFYGRMAGWAGSVLLLAALFWASVAKTIDRTPVKVLGIVGLICIAFWVYSNIHQLVVAVRTRGAQAAMSSALFSVMVLAILVLVNYMGGRYEVFRADLTKNKQYSLSEQTVKIVKGLDQKLTITAFLSDEAMNAENLRRLLNEYGAANRSKIGVTIYDFKTDVDKVQEYGARFDGTMYVESGEEGAKRKEEIQGGTEEQITSAIMAVTTGQKTKLYFLTGHGEGSLTGSGGGGENEPSYSTLKSILENQQYEVQPLNLIPQKQPQIPGDCQLLVIAGAKYAPTAKEMAAIKQYVDQGGNLFLMLEPPPAPDFADLLRGHGVTPLAGKVSDPLSSAEGNPTILASLPEQHDVTRGLQFVVLPTAVGFDVAASEPPPAMPGAPPPPDPKAKSLLQTSDAATVAGVAGRKGPLSVAVAIDESPAPPPQMPGQPPPEEPAGERKARLIAIGDADFTSDNFVNMLGGLGRQNIAFASMCVNWLVKNDKLVSIPPKQQAEMPFNVTDSQRRFVTLLTVAIVPLLIIVAGVFIWWRRRV